MAAPAEELTEATIRFAGDAGDGMQLAGAQFTLTATLAGNDVSTLTDLPAEIRAPAGSLASVSAFQVHVSGTTSHTPGDLLDTLVAMNPAALKSHLPDLRNGGVLIVNSEAFQDADFQKAGYTTNPLDDGSLRDYCVVPVPMASLTRTAVAKVKVAPREADRCKNFFALGLVYWLYERPLEHTLNWNADKFAANVAVREANARALLAGYQYGETNTPVSRQFRVPTAPLAPGRYRRLTGNEAAALGLVAAAQKARLPLLFAAYPSASAGGVLHQLAEMKRFEVKTFQAEDEVAAVGAALGAAYGGGLGVTATGGPGVSLKSEAIALAVMTELPLVILNVQHAGPSNGLPTRTEQADLLQALFGRNGECPIAVLAPSSPSDCFATMFEAARLAITFMTPVFVLSDRHLANAAEPWRVLKADDLSAIAVAHAESTTGGNAFQPYNRDERLVRPWALPGTPGLEHRLGGLEKQPDTGNVSYEPGDHEQMVRVRAQKIANIAHDIPVLTVDGPEAGELLVIGWGSTHAAISAAVRHAQSTGLSVAHAHLRYLNPLPRNTGDVLKRYRRILVPELNGGQLRMLLRAEFLIDAVGLNKVQGKPFLVSEIAAKIAELVHG
jgi:2-oxoglutarate ferredoxin oxidoreductase subunit alpha